jgi:hypothetical protein
MFPYENIASTDAVTQFSDWEAVLYVQAYAKKYRAILSILNGSELPVTSVFAGGFCFIKTRDVRP